MSIADRHPSTQAIARYFRFDHLPAHLAAVSVHCAALANQMIGTLPDGPELTAGLRKLLEAKDCFVRAALDAAPREETAMSTTNSGFVA